MDNLIDKLKDLGFNSYEAKVYLALLRHHPATGYEISKESGVPQARAYDTLKALEANQVVVALGGKPVTYIPISPDELLNRWEKSFKGALNYLRYALPSMANETVDPVVNLRGHESLVQHANDLINAAEKNIFMEIWAQDLPKLREALEAAIARGVTVKIVGYNGLSLEGCEVYQHGLGDELEKSNGGRITLLSVDERDGLVCMLSDNGRTPQGVYTRNAALVLVIKLLIVHDMYLLEVEDAAADTLEDIFGKDLIKLRKKIMGDETRVLTH
jgi:sugar-specific transcriptional regulator TrmB